MAFVHLNIITAAIAICYVCTASSNKSIKCLKFSIFLSAMTGIKYNFPLDASQWQCSVRIMYLLALL